MNSNYCRHLVSLFVYCGVAALVIVNGQSTTDDDIDKDEMINRLIDIVAELRAEQALSNDRIAKLEGQLFATSATKPNASTFSAMIHTFQFVYLLLWALRNHHH